MAADAQLIIRQAQEALQDLPGVRYPASELVRFLNAAQVLIVISRPEQAAGFAEAVLSAGVEQALPAQLMSLIEVERNTAGAQTPVTKVLQSVLDACAPGWRAAPPSLEVVHYCFDLRKPREFLVYPPAKVGAKLRVSGVLYPADVPAPTGDGRGFSTVSGGIGVPDHWTEALLCYCLHRAYAKDASDAGNAALSAGYLSKFNSLLGVQQSAAAAISGEG